ncbi:MAG TPA: TIGR03089 family protein [Dermatophilaceae bacterium]|nr:TIGR03089 family protein [Dermatophilaceae bacterium]
MSSPADVLAHLLASDPGRPRVTQYDDTDGPARGERVELSARALANWVAKAASLLVEEHDAGPGTRVRLALPPHWRLAYWALATWSVGGCVDLDLDLDLDLDPDLDVALDPGRDPGRRGAGPADVVVSDDPVRLAAAASGPGSPATVLVTLPALARAAAGPVPPGAVDEARELAAYPDVLPVVEEPAGTDPALATAAGTTAYLDVVPHGRPAGTRLHTSATDPAAFLGLALGAWAADGSVVLSRGPVEEAVLAARLRAEGVTAGA